MAIPPSFPSDVAREIRSAACATDATARVSHVELALRHFEASGDAPDDAAHRRRMIETAVFVQVAFAGERPDE